MVRVGVKSNCSHVYLPRDMMNANWQDNIYVAETSIDWWMLSVIIGEKCFNLVFGDPKNTPSRQGLIDKFIDAGYDEIVDVLRSQLSKK